MAKTNIKATFDKLDSIILNTGMDVDDIRSCCHFLDNLITNFF